MINLLKLSELECTQLRILPTGPTKVWKIRQTDELDEFYCIGKQLKQLHIDNKQILQCFKIQTKAFMHLESLW